MKSALFDVSVDDLNIVNVVGTGEIQGNVNLEHLYEASDPAIAQYDPIHHQGCYFRFEGKEGPLITMYNSGKYIIRAESMDKVLEQKDEMLEYLKEIGVPGSVVNLSFGFNNIVSTVDLGREFDLEALAEDLEGTDDDASAFRGRLSVRYPEYNSTLNIFRKGKVVILGAPTIEDAESAFGKLIDELTTLFENESRQ